jgi:hypothetical protein
MGLEKWTPGYWGEKIDRGHNAPAFVRWLLGVYMLLLMALLPFALLSFLVIIGRVVWVVITAL